MRCSLDGVIGGWNAVAVDGVALGRRRNAARVGAERSWRWRCRELERVCEEKQQREHFAMFVRRYVADPDQPPSWREVGEPFGLDEKTARSRTETAARQFRSLLRQLIASDIGAGEDVDHELQAVLAVL